MSNELILEKPWWKRNILGLLTIALVIGLATTGSSLFMNGNIDFYTLANADPSFYEVALDSANSNQSVVQKFGHLKPVSKQELVDGTAFYSNNKNTLNISLPVSGAKVAGSMDLWLQRRQEGWRYESIVIKSSAVKITVYQKPSTNVKSGY